MDTIEPSLILMWNHPRKIVNFLEKSSVAQFCLIIVLTLFYFMQIGIYILSLEKLTFAPLLTLKGLYLVLYSIFAIGFGLAAVIYILTLVLWVGAKCCNGQGTLPQTRAAVIWTLMWSIPLAFFILLIFLTIRQPDHGLVALSLRILSYLGVIATMVYGFVVLMTTLSEMHKINLFRASSAIILGLMLLAAFSFVLCRFLHFLL